MALGYDGKLYILAFDHRGSFQKKLFGIEGDPTPEQTDDDLRRQAPDLRGACRRPSSAASTPPPPACWSTSSSAPTSPSRPRSAASSSRCRSRRAGQNEFDFQYGEDFGDHIEQFDPDFSKVLVRYNPDGDAEMNERQLGGLKRLADWLHEHDRKFLFELLVPADRRPARAGRRRQRPLRRRAAPRADAARDRGLQDFGVEVDIWKIEGVDEQRRRRDARRSRPARRGRDGVVCVLLGRGATTRRSTTGCSQAAPVEGFVGFAIGRSIWWDPLKGFLDGYFRATTRRVRSPKTTCVSCPESTSRVESAATGVGDVAFVAVVAMRMRQSLAQFEAGLPSRSRG